MHSQAASKDNRIGGVTVEWALYALIFIAGAAVRFYDLALRPLNPLEAWNGWAAWQAAAGLPGPDALTPTSPLWHSLQTALFWLGADGDAWARCVSAAAGALLVLVPWMLRSLWGRRMALILSLLIAFDPWLILFSRTADGAMLSAALAMALLANAARFLHASSRRNESSEDFLGASEQPAATFTAILAGLFVVSGHMAWSFALVLLAFVLLRWQALRRTALFTRRTALWAGVSALAGATLWLAQVDGLAGVSAGLSMWLDSVLATGMPVQLTQLAGGYPLGWPLTRLLIDQPLLAVFGVTGLAALFAKSPRGSSVESAGESAQAPDRLFLGLWLAWAIALCLLPGRGPFSLLVLVMPLLIGAAYALDVLAAGASRYARHKELPALMLTLAILSVSGAFWGITLVSKASFEPASAQAVAVLFVLGLAVLILYGAWSGVRHALWAGAVAAGVILAAASLSSVWQLNHRYSSERRDGLFVANGGEGLRRLAADIHTMSAQRAGDAQEIALFVDSTRAPDRATDVLLGWYLRDMRRMTWARPPRSQVTARHRRRRL